MWYCCSQLTCRKSKKAYLLWKVVQSASKFVCGSRLDSALGVFMKVPQLCCSLRLLGSRQFDGGRWAPLDARSMCAVDAPYGRWARLFDVRRVFPQYAPVDRAGRAGERAFAACQSGLCVLCRRCGRRRAAWRSHLREQSFSRLDRCRARP